MRTIWAFIGVIVIIAAAVLIFKSASGTPDSSAATSTSDISTTTSALPASRTAVHLDIFVHGAQLPLPQSATSTPSGLSLGMTENGVVIFIPSIDGETLGQVFDAWHLKLTPTCIDIFCADASNSFRIYVNGKLSQGSPRLIPVHNHDEVAITYGTSAEIPNPVPSSYQFPIGF